MLAIILVGGQGTRLRSVIKDLPKPMAPIGDKPFLAHLLLYLQTEGVTEVILSTCYLANKIKDYFGRQYAGINLRYVQESTPLGTGGAIKQALAHVQKQSPVFVMNGDTFLKLDYRKMFKAHEHDNITIALRYLEDCSRYGKVIVKGDTIDAFCEKGERGSGFINAGVYLMQPDVFLDFNLPQQFSLETEFITPYLSHIAPKAYIANDYFIDIGIPEDYQKAVVELC